MNASIKVHTYNLIKRMLFWGGRAIFGESLVWTSHPTGTARLLNRATARVLKQINEKEGARGI